MQSTHAFTIDGATSAQFRENADPFDVIDRVLSSMDGEEAFAFSVWRTPTDVDWRDLNLVAWPVEYLQAAGSSEAMTVELRRLERGLPRHYAVGRAGARGSRPTRTIAFGTNGAATAVSDGEIFTAEEASVLFRRYFGTQTVPERYELRALGGDT